MCIASRTIFVGNLPWTVGNKELRAYFSKFGRVIMTEVQFDWETGLSKGYGFVRFRNKEDCKAATSKTKQELEGGVIYVRQSLS